MFCDVRLAVAASIDFFFCQLLMGLSTLLSCWPPRSLPSARATDDDDDLLFFFCLQVWEKQASNTRQTRAKKRETQRNFPSASGGGGSFIAQSIRKKKKFCELNFFFSSYFFSVCLTVCERRLRSGAEKKTRKIYCEIYFPRIISLA